MHNDQLNCECEEQFNHIIQLNNTRNNQPVNNCDNQLSHKCIVQPNDLFNHTHNNQHNCKYNNHFVNKLSVNLSLC
jgi:hypothetical protein